MTMSSMQSTNTSRIREEHTKKVQRLLEQLGYVFWVFPHLQKPAVELDCLFYPIDR